MVRVAVAREDVLFGEGLRMLLAADPALEYVGQSGLAGLDGLIEVERPDVLLVDSRMGGALGLCGRLRSRSRPRPVLLCAPADDDGWAAHALEAGAKGVLCLRASPDTLLKAVRAVHAGEVWASHRVISKVVEAATAERERRDATRRPGFDCLSEREGQVRGTPPADSAQGDRRADRDQPGDGEGVT